jgi:PAS domain S-box-containing protein
MADKRTVLVLEDDPVAREILSGQMEKDYRVLTAASVADVEELLGDKGEAPDLVLMDYMLEEGTAFEAYDYLTAKGLDAPVIMVTAQGDEEMAVRALKHGFSDYITKQEKNLHRELLRSKIEAAVEMHKLRLENERLNAMIEESQQRLFNVYDSLDDVIIQIDDGCSICSVNRAGAAYANLEPKEVVGKLCWEIFDFYPCQKRRKKGQCHIYRTFVEGETISGERTGSESGRSYQYMSFITEHRGREYVVYRETDITGRRTIEEKLDKALQAVLNPPRGRRKR